MKKDINKAFNTQVTSRRGFLKASGALGLSLVVGFNSKGKLAYAATDVQNSSSLNPFVMISEDGTVTAIAKHFEMGQGTTTGLTTLIAEELDVPWQSIEVAFAPSDNAKYANLAFGGQGTGGSTAIANSFMQYRQAGAAARDLLIRAAAETWDVPAEDVSLEDGKLKAGNNSAGFGELLKTAATLTPVENPTLKNPADFTLIGKDKLPRKDSYAKTNGTAVFAMDVKVPNMLYTTVLRSPKFGGKLKSFDASAAASIDGFVDAKALGNGSGVAVYANSTWSSIKARNAITAAWDEASADARGSTEMLGEYKDLLNAEPVLDATGNDDFQSMSEAAANARHTVEAEFHFPLLAHSPMEPLNCVIEPTQDGGVVVHDGCQMPMITHSTVAAILQIPPEKVDIKTYYAGGSFGRRANSSSDYQAEAAMAFAALDGKKAIKLIWTREDDLSGGFYRPMFAHRAKIGIGEDGKLSAWAHQTVAQSIAKGTPFEEFLVHNGVDHLSVEGIADTPYRIPLSVGLSDYETPMPVLWWRSVGHSQSGYTMEVLIDMAAEAAGIDPVQFRLNHLDENDENQARFAGVLKLAAEKAGWGTNIGEGKGRGIAVHKSFDTYVAEVAEVSVNESGAISVDRVVCAVDCGIAVNPDVVRAQMEGSVGYGLGAIMRNEITKDAGVVEQINFPQYKPLRINDMPDVEVHIVQSDKDPSGVGEPGLPPAGPALANAIFDATGQRHTRLPLSTSGVKFA